MSYKSANEIKSSFDEVYHGKTPHAYFSEMQRLGYEIGEQARPYFSAAARLLDRQLGPGNRVRLLDLGCSYGVGSALLKSDVSFRDLADFFLEHASQNHRECVEETKEWVEAEATDPALDCAGADASKEAIEFATETGLIEAGIARNLEEGDTLGEDDVELLKHCNLLTSTGAIGYVGPKTLRPFLELLGKDLQLPHGPYAVVTILRMFDPKPVAEVFSKRGYVFSRVPRVRLRQRHFDGRREYEETLALLRERGVDPTGWESDGFLYADLFAAAPLKDVDTLVRCLQDVRVKSTVEDRDTVCP